MNYAKVGFQPFLSFTFYRGFSPGKWSLTKTVDRDWTVQISVLDHSLFGLGPSTFTVLRGIKIGWKLEKVNKSPADDPTSKISRIFQIIGSQLDISHECCQLKCQQFKCHQYFRLIDKFVDRRRVTNFINKWTFVTKFVKKWNLVTNFHFVTNTTVTIYINTTPSATIWMPISTHFRILPFVFRTWTLIWDQWTGIISKDTATKWTTTKKSKNWSLRDAFDDSKIDKVAKSKFKV